MYGGGKKPITLKIQKLPEDNIIKNIWNLSKLKRENKATKYRIISGIKTLFEQQEEGYCKRVRVCNFWNKNYIECKSSGDTNKNLSVKVYFKEIKSYLRDLIINLQKSDSWQFQLTIAINFISSKNVEEE